MFIAALLIMDKIWSQSKCPSTGKWKNKIWYIYNGILFSNTKEGTTYTSYTMDEPQNMLRERSQSLTITYCVFPFT